jgi:histone-lysine N-methyltransferase SETD3
MMTTVARPTPRSRIDRLLDWLQAGGAWFPSLAVRVRGDGQRGAFAARGIRAAQPVLAVPHRMLITHTMALGSPIGRALRREGIDPADSHTYLAAFLIVEARDPRSPWRPYLDVLPASHAHMPCFFEPQVLELLDGTAAAGRIERQRRELARCYTRLRAVRELAELRLEELVWGRLTVLSRVFRVKIDDDTTDALVPLADLLDHAPRPEVSWGFDELRRAFVATARDDVAAGAPVRDSYGAKSNARFLTNYGFCLDDDDADETFLPVRAPCDDEDHPFLVTRSYRDREVQRLFAYARLSCANDDELALHGFRKQGDVAPITSRNERAALELIGDASARALARLPGTIAEDDALLADPRLAPAARQCVLVRRGEKRVLAAFRELARELAPLLHLSFPRFLGAAADARPSSRLARDYLSSLIASV